MSAPGTMGYDRTPTGTAGIAFGEYRLIRRLGSGGMAEVFLAKREGPGGFEKNLVIKRILPHLSASPRFTELFLKEARLGALIDHPNLVHVSSFGQIDGQYYLAMEYVDGFTVHELLSRVGAVTPGVACRIAVELLGALHAIHAAKLVHRDVTARNVMVTRDGAVKLLDFGIAVTLADEAFAAMGTKKYMPPEQLDGQQVDHRADLFGVGVILYELICGDTPPPAPKAKLESTARRKGRSTDERSTGWKRPPEIPEALWSTVERLMARSAESRPGSAREVQAELEIYLSARGMEGTRAHLADVIGQVAPQRSAPLRVLSRLTQLTSMTRPSPSHASLTVEPRRSRSRSVLVAGLVAIGAGAVIFALAAREPDAQEVALSTPPPVLPPPLAMAAPPPVPLTATATIAAAAEAHRPRTRRIAPLKPGRLTIDTRPWTEVFIGRRRLGLTPVVDVKLPSGKHELTLRNDKLGLSRRITVTIRPGKTTRIQRTL